MPDSPEEPKEPVKGKWPHRSIQFIQKHLSRKKSRRSAPGSYGGGAKDSDQNRAPLDDQ
jgi:hypothetical protein